MEGSNNGAAPEATPNSVDSGRYQIFNPTTDDASNGKRMVNAFVVDFKRFRFSVSPHVVSVEYSPLLSPIADLDELT